MWSNPQKTADLATFTKETLNGKLHFLWSELISDFMQCVTLSASYVQEVIARFCYVLPTQI